MGMCNGWISKIERFSLHDGPGIRTLVVMKGCPLRCLWCSSPHTQRNNPEVLYIQSRCTACELCMENCPQKAISREDGLSRIATNRALCVACGRCVQVCIHGAREISGIRYTPQELLQTVEKDESFYRRSAGGVTVGGGEPTMQAGFLAKFLSLCRSHDIHTAMETCAFVAWDKLAPLLDLLDLVYIDLKHMHEKIHQEWTGVSNRLILENIRKTARHNRVILRIPIVPGFNDSFENIQRTAAFAKEQGRNILRLELLPYHRFGIHKYSELERACPLESMQPPAAEHMKHMRNIACTTGIDAAIGG